MNIKVGKNIETTKRILAIIIVLIIFTQYPNAISDSWPSFLHDPEHTGNSTSSGPSTNTTFWTVASIGGNAYSSPSVANGRVFINRGGAGTLYCLYERNGTEIWTASIGNDGSRSSTPAVYQGKVYVIGTRLYCFYPISALARWTRS